MNITDGELLRRYTRNRSETAFEELVQRHVNLIYSAALRQVNGDAQLAEDVTQCVFTDLARKAAQLSKHPSLTGWLYTSTRFIAANLRRSQQRRFDREQQAQNMNALDHSSAPETDWAQMRPLLDDVMHMLDEQDREAVLLRHFEQRSFAEIGEQLGLAENAARMRVSRALEKLQDALRKHGVTSTALALAGLLTANGVGAAPAYLAAKVARTALAGTATVGGASAMAQLFTAGKMKFAAALLLLGTITALVINSNQRQNHARVDADVPASNVIAAAPAAVETVAGTPAVTPSTNSIVALSATNTTTNGLVLHLEIVASDGGQPVPDVPIEYRGWAGKDFKRMKLTSDSHGICDVVYPTNITDLQLTTREDDFADTKLLWRPPNGEVIPASYVLRLDQPVAIGGRVVDADGHPVAGAKVGWNHEEAPSELKLPQNHEFAWIEVTTDNDGRWRINRMAADIISRIYGSARESNHVDSPMVFVARDKNLEKQLRAENHVFQLGNAVTIHGTVVDENGQGIPNAKILVGNYSGSDKRTAKSQSDGAFTVTGCNSGTQLVSANAKGFAVTTIETNLSPDAEPIRLVLHSGKVLRLRVVNKSGDPVAGAQIYYEENARNYDNLEHPAPPQVDFNPKTDAEGRAVWTNAPDVEMGFDVEAAGYLRTDNHMIRPDGEEHTITISPALVVHGTVTDGYTSQPIPRFGIVLGWPDFDPASSTNVPHWSTLGRFWLNFSDGKYRHAFEESPISSTDNRGYFLKFTAEGYAPVVSRFIGADEGDVQLDVTLRPANESLVLVYKPDGQPAANADIGLVIAGSHLQLNQGGFYRDTVESGGSLLRTGGDGTFKLPADESLQRIIAASADGYAEALPADAATSHAMRMQPWGNLVVNCLSNGQPEPGREYLIELGNGSRETVSLGWGVAMVKSDAQGRISVPTLPPGSHYLTRMIPQPFPTGTAWSHGTRTPFQILPAQTTTLDLDANNTVIGSNADR